MDFSFLLQYLTRQQKYAEKAHYNLVSNSHALTCVGLQTAEDFHRFNAAKKHLEEKGIKCVERKEFEPGKEISLKALSSIIRWKPKFLKESAKCIKRVREYIKNKEKCIMFYKMSDQCIHQIFNNSVIQCIEHMHQTLKYPRIYAPFKFEMEAIAKFVQWMDELDRNQYYPFCSICMNIFWSNQQITEIFLNYSASLGLSTCELQGDFLRILLTVNKKLFDTQFDDIMNFYVKVLRPKCFEESAPTAYDEKSAFNIMEKLFILVQITDIWHRFMLHPQFIRYHLFRNMKVFKIFLKYWHSMRAIDITVNCGRIRGGDGVYHQTDVIFDIIHKYMRYLLDKYNDISYCFYSMMKCLKKKHLKKKYLGCYVMRIEERIGGKIVSNTDNYQCLLNLIWKKLTYKYNQYNVDIAKFVHGNLMMLPLNEHDDANMDDIIRQKLKLKIKCAISVKCKTKTNLKLCSKCKMVYYCSRHCQKIHWNKVHRFVCLKIERNFTKY